VIRCTFQLAPGLGAYRERQLWAAGVRSWDEVVRRGEVLLAPGLDARLRAAVAEAGDALAAGDAARLAAMLPRRERWRLYPSFEEDAAFVDVEADADELTVVGLLDRDGPRALVRGRDLAEFPERARRWKLLVTYNGSAFDVPALERAFPGWRAPAAHVDLRRLWMRLGHEGGLKLLEAKVGIARPPHVAALRGGDAGRLWREHEAGDGGALRRLVEYNLYDAVDLKALMVLAYNRMVERLELPAPPLARWERGDVLYDMTKQLLGL
jgi:uncharacterized protein YprB with RNaseH-like and TPR domain